MTLDQINQEWESIISGAITSSYNRSHTDWSEIYDWISERIHETQVVLDYGCGLGHLCKLLSDNGHVTLGVDVSHVALEAAKTRSPETEFELIPMDDVKSIRDGEYNAICFTEVLEHIEDDIYLVRNIPQGRTVFISLPIGLHQIASLGHVRAFVSAEDALARYRPHLFISEWTILPEFEFLVIKGKRR